MPGPLPAIDDITLRRKTEQRSIQEMFTPKATVIKAISNVDGATGGTSGLIRITAASHGLSTGDEVIIAGVGGTTEANGYFTVTEVSASQFTLDGTTFTNPWTSGGDVCNGLSYAITAVNTSGGAAPSNPGVAVVNNYKKLSGGLVYDTPVITKSIQVTTDVEIFTADPTYYQAVSSLVITNNSGASVTGSVKLRTTKLLALATQAIIPFILPDDYSLVIGGDGVRSMYKGDSLPYVS